MARPSRRLVASLVAAALPAAACTGGDDATPQTTAAVTTTTEPPREDDGILTIGLLLPSTDALLGQGLFEAAGEAIERVNEAGGVLGRPVRVVEADEGSTPATASESIGELLQADVDAIVGPSSSLIALSNLSQILDAGVLSCSPTASALALDDYPDDDLLFFRTIPSDSLQARAIAQVVEDTGSRTAAIAFADDAYGQSFAAAVVDALRERSIVVAESVAYRAAEDDLSVPVDALVASEAQVVVVLANNDDAASLLEALGQADFLGIRDVVVNDALRNPASAQRIEALDGGLRNRITGVAPQAIEDDPDDEGQVYGPFGVNAFDCVNLIALAAVQGDSDSPDLIKTQMQSVSEVGRLCRTFANCVERLGEGLEINYNGPSGITELLQRGDPRRARFELFRFDDTGRDQTGAPFLVEY